MTEMIQFVKAWFDVRVDDERGATAVEYGLMVALIAVAIAVTVGLLGGQLNTLFGTVRTTLGGAPAGG